MSDARRTSAREGTGERSSPRSLDERLRGGGSPSGAASGGQSAVLDLQRAAGNNATGRALGRGDDASAEIRRQRSGGGDDLSGGVRAAAERTLGTDARDVRVHAGPEARALAGTLGARAFTVGRDVWLGPGESAHDTRLLSHELAHVAQQAAGPVTGRRVAPDLTVSDPSDHFERAASRAADKSASPRRAASGGGATTRTRSRAASRSGGGGAGGTLTVQREAATAPPAQAPRATRRELTKSEEAEMQADVALIVGNLKSKFLSNREEYEIVSVLDKWYGRDARLSGGITPYLDEILLRLKMRAYSRSPASTPWVDVWAIAYDDLWHRLGGQRLEMFKDLVSRSKGQRTSGPGTAEGENFWRTLGKQEAIGMWAMLKGMGTGAAALADDAKWLIVKDMQMRGIPVKDPGSAADWLAKQFDESGDIMFGKDYTEGEVLFWGLTPKDIGTGGGSLIWQLVMMGKGSGGALMKALQLAGAMRGVEEAAQEIADIVADMQKRDGKVDAAKLAEDPRFWKAVTKLAASIFSAMSAGASPNASAAAKAAQSRINLLLDAAQLAPLAGELVKVWTSDESTESKKAKSGPILLETLSKLITLALSTKAHVDEHGKKGKGGPAEKEGGTSEEQRADTKKSAEQTQAEVKAEPEPKPKPKRKAPKPVPVVAPEADAAAGVLTQAKNEGPTTTETSATPVTQDAVAQAGKSVAETTKVVEGEGAVAPVATVEEAPTTAVETAKPEVKPVAEAVVEPTVKPGEAEGKAATDDAAKKAPARTKEQLEIDAMIAESIAGLEPEGTKPLVDPFEEAGGKKKPAPKATTTQEPEPPKTYPYESFKQVPLDSIPAADKAKYTQRYDQYKKEGGQFSLKDYMRFRYGADNQLFNVKGGGEFDVESAAGRVAEDVIAGQTGTPHNKKKLKVETSHGNVEPDFMPVVDEKGKVTFGDDPKKALFVAESKILTEPATGPKGETTSENGVPLRQARAIGLTDQIRGLIEVASKTQSQTLVFVGQEGASLSKPLLDYAAAHKPPVTLRVKILTDASGKPIKG